MENVFERYEYDYPLMSQEVRAKIKDIEAVAARIEAECAGGHCLPDKVPPYLVSLNPAQLRAAMTLDGPIMVIAGAGSGKTTTLTYRILHMVKQGIAPENILLLTFTKKAAAEMLERAGRLLGGKNEKVKVGGGTFHSFANAVMKKYAPMIGEERNFTILDTDDATDVIKLVLDDMGLAKKDSGMPKPAKIQEFISKAKNSSISLEMAVFLLDEELVGIVPTLELIAERYAAYKALHSMMDYDDLIEKFLRYLEENELFRRAVQNSYTHIMVDEYQDTNLMQDRIVRIIAEGHGNLMVVGDDSQSIYAFRGANIDNILCFPLAYPNCITIKLEENFRSTPEILSLVNAINDSAGIGYRKVLFSGKEGGTRPVVAPFNSQNEEASAIVQRIIREHGKGTPYKECAVLFRSSYHSTFIQAELTRRKIPFVVFGGMKFSEKRHIKDVMAFFKIICNDKDKISWLRIFGLLEGVGGKTAKIILDDISNLLQTGFAKYEGKKFHKGLNDLAQIIDFARGSQDAKKVFSKIMTFYRPLIKDEEDYQKRSADLDVLEEIVAEAGSLDEFIDDFILESPDKTSKSDAKDYVVLSTVHSAKGLEWTHVFVCHLLDGMFPSKRSLDSFEDIEEERRLFYVAASRAKQSLHLSYPVRINTPYSSFDTPCRFLQDIDATEYSLEMPEYMRGY